MKTPEYVYLVMYPSDDPLNEPLESFRVNRVFMNYPAALYYLRDLFKMIPAIEINQIYSETLNPQSREFTRMYMQFEVTAPFKKSYKYAIVKMKLHGELLVNYPRNMPYLHVDTLHILDFDPKLHRPETEYDSIHSVHSTLEFDTFDEITGGQKLDWRRPFGHKTNHMYTPYIDATGSTKYLVTLSHQIL